MKKKIQKKVYPKNQKTAKRNQIFQRNQVYQNYLQNLNPNPNPNQKIPKKNPIPKRISK